MPNLSQKQRTFLLTKINPRRVLQSQGQLHLPAFDVEAYLTRVFGFEGWDREILDLWLISEALEDYKDRSNVEKQGWTVTYGCKLRLSLRNPEGELVKVVDGCATGSANHLPLKGDAHDFAMKNADSYALKRCAKALGDQFGLSLYNKGSLEPVVRGSYAYSEQTDDQDVPTPQSLGNDERDHEGGPENWPELHRDPTVAEQGEQARMSVAQQSLADARAALPRNQNA